LANIKNVCRFVNARLGWSPGTCERLYYKDICEYWSTVQYMIKFEADGDFRYFVQNTIETQSQRYNRTKDFLRNFKKNKGII
jgi:hypothetical protein